MRKSLLTALALASAAVPAAADAQTIIAQPLAGTRLDVSATGEVARVPDLAIISAGVRSGRKSGWKSRPGRATSA